jgi:hypothetical protein
MDFLKGLLITLVNSSIIIGICSFLLKKYFEKWIYNEFEKRRRIGAIAIERLEKLSHIWLEKEIGIYPEIYEITYRLHNIIKDGITKPNAYSWDPNLRPLCTHLTENLYKYRIFLDDKMFNALHDFKRIVQDALMMIDISTRNDKVCDVTEYLSQLDIFKHKYDELHIIFDKVCRLVSEKFNVAKEAV